MQEYENLEGLVVANQVDDVIDWLKKFSIPFGAGECICKLAESYDRLSLFVLLYHQVPLYRPLSFYDDEVTDCERYVAWLYSESLKRSPMTKEEETKKEIPTFLSKTFPSKVICLIARYADTHLDVENKSDFIKLKSWAKKVTTDIASVNKNQLEPSNLIE